ncbi:MAG: hypothetical protein NXY57DRAFT_1042181 [Lentinula lateritia]|nr:MAG: hypothetical protein NXY57DRAFT_1042181 [Lentinula lateritia]
MDQPVPVQPSPFADRGLIGSFPPPYQSQAPSQNPPQPSRSPQFWDSGIMVVFSAVQELPPQQTILYRVSIDSLRCRSKVLDDIFGIPPSTQSQNEGTEGNPIALPTSITSEKFESFLMYLNCRGWNKFDDKVPANILNLLDISALLEADGALSYAMSKVVGLRLPAAQLLGLAWRHRVHPQVQEWIEPAVMGLLNTPLRCHSADQESSIGLAYPVIAKARERIQEARLILAAIPFQLAPRDLLFPECPDELHKYCEKSWLFFWYQNITVELIHPTKPPLSYNGLVQLVQETKFENLQDGCKARTLDRMRLYGDYPTVPDIFHSAVLQIIELFNIPSSKCGRKSAGAEQLHCVGREETGGVVEVKEGGHVGAVGEGGNNVDSERYKRRENSSIHQKLPTIFSAQLGATVVACVQAMKLLTQRFPLLKDIQLNPAEVDTLAPRHIQLHQVGLLRHLTQHENLQNTDPKFNVLELSLKDSFAGYDDVDFEAIEDLTAECLEDLLALATPSRLNPWQNSEAEDLDRDKEEEDAEREEEDTDGTSGEEWSTHAEQKKSTRKRKRRANANTPRPRKKTSRPPRIAKTKSPPQFPSVSYEKRSPIDTPAREKFHALRPANLSSKEWKAERKRQYNAWWQGQKHARVVEVHTVQDGFDVPRDSRISKPAWMGLRASADMRSSIQLALTQGASQVAQTILEGITRIPYVPTTHEVTIGFPLQGMTGIIARPNATKRPEATKFQKNNHLAITRAFNPGQIFHTLTFPAIAQRYQDSVDYMKAKFGIHAMFGLFFNFCLNSPRKGIPRVFCQPHVDWKNTAFGVCMIFVFGIALELPPGVFLFYPSSLFLHFNVDLEHLPIFTTKNGEKPTSNNSTPLYSCNCHSHDQNSAWARAEGRGSMVWFNQASMFQTSELGINTLREAREAGMDTNCDAKFWLEQGVFPTTL